MTDGDRSRAGGSGVAASVASLLTAAFLLPWWNRHLGLSLDGYMPLYGAKILAGEVPYRDFYLHLPPLQPLGEAALQALFGKSLLAVRLVGALGRIALAAVTAAWLARSFRPLPSAFASFVAVVIASSDDTEILDLYNHHALLGAVLSGWLAALALGGRRRSPWLWAAAGAAAACAFWIKQTIGVGALVAVPIAIVAIALRADDERRALARAGSLFALGVAAASLPIVAWLLATGAFSAFVDQVFAGASASKGPPSALLLRPWRDPFLLPQLRARACAGLGIAVAAALALRPRAPDDEPHATRRSTWLAAVAAGTLALFAASIAARTLDASQRNFDLILEAVQVGLFAGHFGAVLLATALAIATLRGHMSPPRRELLLLTVVAVVAAAMNALSFPGGGVMALPAVALVAASCWQGESRFGARRTVRALFALPFVAAALAGIAIRQIRPFAFAQWHEPPLAQSTERSALPELAGLRLSPATVGMVEEIVGLVQRVTRPDEPLFTYPVYPIFNWLADRPTATFAILHWIDVTPDHVVDADLERILTAPPPAVIYQYVRGDLMRMNESYFRRGQRSSVHRMEVALGELLMRDYQLASSRRVRSSPIHTDLQLWIRKDRAIRSGIAAVEPSGGWQPGPD